MVAVRSFIEDEVGKLAHPLRILDEIYISEAGLLVLSSELELPYRREGEDMVVLSVRHTVKARRITS